MALGKHFINDVDEPVSRALRAQLAHDSALRLIEFEKVLFRQQPSSSQKVILLSGGGSGHEPAHAGYLGDGMLDVAVVGNVFASPSSKQILAGLNVLEAPRGTLIVVKNYTGDKLNFGLAVEKAKASGRVVSVVIVGDDVSIDCPGLAGRRGLAGVVFVHKVAGAAAASGASLAEVTLLAQMAADSLATVGVSLDRCSVPQREKQEALPLEELEYGMGIHNEPGAHRSTIQHLQETVSDVIKLLTRPSAERWYPRQSQEMALMINDLGGLSVFELNVIADEVTCQLHQQGFSIKRIVSGTFVSSLDGPGFSVTLLGLNEQLDKLPDAPTTAPAWPSSSASYAHSLKHQIIKPTTVAAGHTSSVDSLHTVPGYVIRNVVTAVADSIRDAEPVITQYDTIIGDGDCGETLLHGINAIVRGLDCFLEDTLEISLALRRIASAIEQGMGGTSGAIYAIFFNALSNKISAKQSATTSVSEGLASALSRALHESLAELYRYTPARKGHRTLMDALIPFIETFAETKDLDEACAAAVRGAESTRNLAPKFGRASYVNKDQFDREGGVPDPGAIGVASVVSGIRDGLRRPTGSCLSDGL